MDKPRKLGAIPAFWPQVRNILADLLNVGIRDLKQTTAGLEGFWKTTTALESFCTKPQRMPRSLAAPPKGVPADIQIYFFICLSYICIFKPYLFVSKPYYLLLSKSSSRK